uniref:Rho GTPase activating protein 28 n=1 Tax=Echeneis naucrates TaxID=173247 RepID=A0A665TX31_ECHNA
MFSSPPTNTPPSPSPTPPTPSTVTSDPRHFAMETYWREVQSIEEEREGDDEDEEDDERKSMDEVELEEEWLKESGLSSLVMASEEKEVPPPAEVLLSTLTQQQVATVKRRLDNYNETLKKRNRQPIRDVRDVFTQVWSQSQLTLGGDRVLPEEVTCPTHTETQPSFHLQFVPVSPSHGLTWTDDLSSHDLTQLGFISHIELSTFLLTLGVQTKRTRPQRCRTRDGGVFGVPLCSLLENDRRSFPGVKVPVVFQKLLCILEQTGLQTEGILRVSGSAARLKYLRRELDRCGDLDWSAVRQVDVAGLLKLFIRELPTPLSAEPVMFVSAGVSSVVHQVQALQLLMLLLPEVNRDTLRALLVFLRKVVSCQDQNRMSLWNVSMVMAPNLFSCRHRGHKQSVAKQQEEIKEAVGGAQLVQLMITHQDLLWIVPSFLLSQVRQMNQASNQKQSGLSRTKKLLLRRRSDRNQITDLCEGVIRVCAPLHTKVSMAIQLDRHTRAKDITARFEFENSPVQCLYEVGGNIFSGERRLHPDCVLLDVYRVNPHCDWLIKP